jgi:predicted nucleic acid-binding Zn ribbon protein
MRSVRLQPRPAKPIKPFEFLISNFQFPHAILPLMPTYVYETLGPKTRRFEVRQSMKDAPLTHDPETGAPVRRVISGGYGIMQKGSSSSAPSSSASHSCGSGSCGCC